MRTKKRIKIISLILAVVFTIAIGVIAYSSDSGFMSEWGKYLKNNSTKISQTNYAEGEHATVTQKDIGQAKQFFILSGMEESEAESNAIDYTLEHEALYQAAIENGYTVSGEEIWKYLEELKQIIDSAENKEDFVDIMNQFDSEEEYWNFQFQVYQKDLPIRNYVKDLEKHFMETKRYSNESDNDILKEWENYFEQFKTQLVENENYKFSE